MNYQEFIDRKSQLGTKDGFKPTFMPNYLKDYQSSLIEYAVEQGRSAIFADCGLGKTPMELCYAQNVVMHTNGNILLLTPLAVTAQFLEEAEKFGIEAARSNDGKPAGKITITNYEKLHLFDASDYVGMVCDESSILKSFDGKTKDRVTAMMKKMRYRLLATATAAPNDFIELGTSSEALGYMGYMDMLNRFFKNDQNNSKIGQFGGQTIKWRLKGHAEEHFWRWVTSWARAVRKPSDIGFDDAELKLPELTEHEHMIDFAYVPDNEMFPRLAIGLKEQRKERRMTLDKRCEKIAELVNNTGQPALVWCQMNDEGDELERMIPDAVQVAGKDSDESKEEKMMAFAHGKARILITKPKIGAWGLNFQHCNHVTFFPSHSYEQYYQGVRRCWRFGQKRPVKVDIVTTKGEASVLKNLQRKQQQSDEMFGRLISQMNNALHLTKKNEHINEMATIPWLQS